jgi:putative spermidine/putrescine transport system permease protein
MTNRRSPLLSILVVPIYLYLLLPMLVVVLFSFSGKSYFTFPPTDFSLRWYRAAWELGTFGRPAVLSILLAFGATALAAAVAVPAALALRKLRRSAWMRALEFVLLSPLVVPALIIGIGLLYFFLRLDLIDTLPALVASHTLLVFPFMFRSVLLGAFEIKPQLEEASEVLGASPWQTFRNVVLPALAPGITSGAIFAFIVSFDQFTVSLFVTQSSQTTLPVALYRYVYDVNDPVAAAVSSALVMLGLLIALGLQRAGLLKYVGGRSAG